MKKVIFTLSFAALTLLSACNDGDLVYNDIDFSKNTTVNKCSTTGAEKVHYKIQDKEALLLLIDTNNLMADPTTKLVDTPIDGTNTSLEYRKYSDKLSQENICKIPAPAFPNVTTSIHASPGGTVRTERVIHVKENANNSSGLTYQYAFTLLNVNFQEGDTNIKYDKMFFGTYTYDARTLDFKFTNTDNTLKELNSCNDQYIALSDKEALFINLSLADLPTEETTTAKIINLGQDKTATFKQYRKAGINIDQVCANSGNIPGSNDNNINHLQELWIANEGQISINSRRAILGNGEEGKLIHEITLVNALFIKDQFADKVIQKNNIILGQIAQ
ncbi:hypothetical protein [Myroides pelagicus]|uniref:DUF1735 domain-containing protein n=1 Tax=Myroides pelagicus TaxID=270914 RepID=A0A7K1GKK6_9FLAO|nr:hypothetical protein [Myroides pelagicus]MEC4113833.1 hypothetical protein [Myroides pelagicus]MTH29059.1 hypothetical protein [Myroides pelagicus]